MSVILAFFSALWQLLLDLSLWLFFGAFLAGLLKLFLPKGFIRRHAGGGHWSGIVKTSLLGVPLPLCSCGVLPATIGLKKDGAGNGASIGFLISTPQTGVDSILVTASFLGWPLALFKVLAAFITGIVGGTLVHWTEPKNKQEIPQEVKSANTDSTPGLTRLKQFWDFSVSELIGGIYLYLAIGLVIAAVMTILFPNSGLSQIPALQGFGGMLLMLIIAVPFYVCTTGSVPIAASLIAAGLPIGSALVFLMAGPATNAATLSAILKQFGKRVTAIYLGTVVVGSMAFGWIFQSIGFAPTLSASLLHHHSHAPAFLDILNILAASALVFLMGMWFFRDLTAWVRRVRRQKGSSNVNETVRLHVSNMSCQKCSLKIQNALEKDQRVHSVGVDLESGRVTISGHALDEDLLIRQISDVGYVAQHDQQEA